ncbi:type II toxin-antitoxin system Phd/YefM family antitoxin [Protaetiibacter larvae]|uniref:Antitoxin n=1 Tax=Protaetiibacter larvae TaxID=2592654 RepID=A0A5C1Y942_9MICO|nr:type II toxin-antitoxin system prevent-host-death family antitoxin [Protaetiibacter larvae]QEO09765.1 type II toxin-antitoxin system prevent-host-death family antitoxin [Protaetiibacter larvae]
MEQIGIRALKQNASAVVARVAAGESLVITDRGRAVAQLVPLPATPIERMLADGTASAPARDIRTLSAPAAGPDLSASLREQRDEERY